MGNIEGIGIGNNNGISVHCIWYLYIRSYLHTVLCKWALYTEGCVMRIRVEWFWKIKSCTFYVVPNCCRTPIPKCHVFMLPLSLVAGPLKILTVTLKCAKKQFLFKIFKVFTWNKVCSLACLKAKTEEIIKKNIKIFFRPKTVLPIFGK